MEGPVVKKIKLNIDSLDAVNVIKIEILPRELLCIIFSHLDRKSVRNSTASCKLWFQLIRSDQNLSGYISLEKVGLEQLSQKILAGEWKWAQWPVLKTIKLGGLSAATSENDISCENLFHNKPKPNICPSTIIQNTYSKEITPYLSKLVCFKGCSTLEKVLISFDNATRIIGIFPNHPNLSLEIIEELTFDPKIDVESVGIEHVSRLKLTVDPRFYHRVMETEQKLQLLRETPNNLKNISVISTMNILQNLDSYQLLKKSFEQLFQDLEEKLESFQVIVGNTFHMNTFFSDSKPITEIWIESMDMKEIRTYPLTWYFLPDRYKKLRICRVDLQLTEEDQDQNCDTWPKFVEEIYKDWVAMVRYQLPSIDDFKFRFVYCKRIVGNVQDERFEVLRRHCHFGRYKKVIRFEITRR